MPKLNVVVSIITIVFLFILIKYLIGVDLNPLTILIALGTVYLTRLLRKTLKRLFKDEKDNKHNSK